MNSYPHITQVTLVSKSLIQGLNQLLDEGMIWDIEQGTKFLNNPDTVLFVAHEEEKVVGFLSAYRLQRFDKRKAEVLLYEIAVAEDFRQKGIGKAMIEALKEWSKRIEADEIWVLTNKSNVPAVSLYASHGGTVESMDEVMYTFRLS